MGIGAEIHFAWIVFLIYVSLLILKGVKASVIRNKYLRYISMILLLAPFWYLGFVSNAPKAFPAVDYMIRPPKNTQTIIFSNDTDKEVKLLCSARKYLSNNWESALPLGSWSELSPFIDLAPRQEKIIKFTAGKNSYDILHIKKYEGGTYSSDEYKAVAFAIPTNVIKFYTSEFSSAPQIEFIQPDTSKELMVLLFALAAATGIIYHLWAIPKKWKKKLIIKTALYSFGTCAVAANLYLVYLEASYLLYFI